MRKRIAIIGGGITGLAAAVRLRDRAPADTEITVYEQSSVLGGKLRTGELAGITVERGAESFLFSGAGGVESAAVRFVRRLGLGDALVHPSTGSAAIAVDGSLVPMPVGTLLGVPADPARLGAVAPADADADRDLGVPVLDGTDVAVGELVRRRFGDAVVDRLVDPLLGGVYAGRADRLSLAMTIPGLAAAARREHTLVNAVRAARAAAVRVPGRPVFAAVAGGMSRVVAAASTACAARIALGSPIRELTRTADGWALVLGPAPAPVVEVVDAVVLAVPAAAAARLLRGVDGDAASTVGALDYAGVALIALALPPGTPLPELSGFLVPATEGTLVKAATFITTKWGHLRRPDGPVIVRASAGRAGEEQRLHPPDDTLAATVHAELGALIGRDLPAPLAAWTQRWGGGLPQYAPGHLDRVAAARRRLTAHPGLATAGAAYDGVGIPACVQSGENAADDVLKFLEELR